MKYSKDIKMLRIKRKHFDAILCGDKTIEYRAQKPFYDRLFSHRVRYLRLHYQRERQLIVEVLGIRKIKTPKRLKSSKIDFGKTVYCIRLGTAKILRK